MNAHLKYANRKMFEIGTTLLIAASLLGVLFFAGVRLFGPFSPAVIEKKDGSFQIRYLGKFSRSRGGMETRSYEYFTFDKNGIVIDCPRGLTKIYKGAKVTGLKAAVIKYQKPSWERAR